MTDRNIMASATVDLFTGDPKKPVKFGTVTVNSEHLDPVLAARQVANGIDAFKRALDLNAVEEKKGN